jgi:hypothetical protein
MAPPKDLRPLADSAAARAALGVASYPTSNAGGTDMGTVEREARRERREWLLRVCSQSLQRQQVGPSGRCIQPFQGPGEWRPAPGWAGQNSPEALLPGREDD